MSPGPYAIVSYMPNEVGAFVDFLRQELNPQYAGHAAHVTLLPLRALEGREEEAMEEARRRAAGFEPFEVEVTGVADFMPASNVVYLGVGSGGSELERLHAALNSGRLAHAETFPYVPHITIIQGLEEPATRAVRHVAAERLARYAGPRRFRVESLMFVRQAEDGSWMDLAQLELGPAHVVSR